MNNSQPQVDLALEARINLYYDLRPGTISPAPLLIALHGYGANKRYMMREAQLMAPAQFAIASLQGFHQHIKEPRETGAPLRFGFGWLTNFRSEESVALHHQALLDLIRMLSDEGVADPKRVFLLGFSQSCALNYRFAFTHPEHLRGVVGICGGLPGDWETSSTYRRAEIDVLHLAGTRDEFYPAERVRDYERRLKTRARSVQFKSYDATHEIVPEMRVDVVQWLTKTVDEH
ncbi:MAG TPA: dienelactone hydrolase family protein [Pyrinomonadaceae bacterium]|nr:dienelactone hydrolase family protein [Pyrinomonadaceae bacterium]